MEVLTIASFKVRLKGEEVKRLEKAIVENKKAIYEIKNPFVLKYLNALVSQTHKSLSDESLWLKFEDRGKFTIDRLRALIIISYEDNWKDLYEELKNIKEKLTNE